MNRPHTFHIPVMGTGYSIDTPVKVSKYGISSVISLVDDLLIEQMRKHYCELFGYPYTPIDETDIDHRAKRITEYLNLIDHIVQKELTDLKNSPFETDSEITKYFTLLPDGSPLRNLYGEMLKTSDTARKTNLQKQLRDSIQSGSIDVNIMTKLDKANYDKGGQELSAEYADAMAALRGYAQSTLHSAIVFSAGFNRRLYTYVENFKDFYADTKGFIKKEIIVKVSDYRSAVIQGKFFAKKGLWVSEFRIESGLNCGGHVFPAAGELMGPILEEFKTKKQEFVSALHDMYNQALTLKDRMPFAKPHPVRITAQGGIGTAKEDNFLRKHYEIDSTGWGSPFLLVPEVTNVDKETLSKITNAKEEDYYVSEVSPMGVPFNNIRDSASDVEQARRALEGYPGSVCFKGHLALNTEFTKRAICAASRLYQKLKLEYLARLNLDPVALKKACEEVMKKSCVCNDLGEATVIKNHLEHANRKLFPAICPGPNLAYFSKVVSLQEMADHIYGRINLLRPGHRPHMFLKELKLNIDFLRVEVQKALPKPTAKQIEYFVEFRRNLVEGIEYYKKLFPRMTEETEEFRAKMLEELQELRSKLDELISTYTEAFTNSAATTA